jgi:endonuclease YncB( thermonuclease family)
VTYEGDGDSLCVAVGPSPADWVEVRVSDFYAPELNAPGGQDAKAALERIAKGRRVECRSIRQSFDRVVAQCSVGGSSIGDLMRSAGVREGGIS